MCRQSSEFAGRGLQRFSDKIIWLASLKSGISLVFHLWILWEWANILVIFYIATRFPWIYHSSSSQTSTPTDPCTYIRRSGEDIESISRRPITVNIHIIRLINIKKKRKTTYAHNGRSQWDHRPRKAHKDCWNRNHPEGPNRCISRASILKREGMDRASHRRMTSIRVVWIIFFRSLIQY